ncbi:MAG: hypothetical protein V3T41_04110 [bacterium]
MLRIVNLEEVQGMLRRIPDLVDLQERRIPGFGEEVKRWLVALEKVLDNNRMPVAGNVAALRAMLISAERGVIPAGVAVHGRMTRKKIEQATATLVLHQISDMISDVVLPDVQRIAEAERLTRQLVALGKAKGLVKPPPSDGERTENLSVLWRTLAADPDVAGGTVNVEGLVGPNDALVILDRMIVRDVRAE